MKSFFGVRNEQSMYWRGPALDYVSPYRFWATARYTFSSGNGEFLEASFSMRTVFYEREVGD